MTKAIIEKCIQEGNVHGINALLAEDRSLAKFVTSHGVSPIMLARYYGKTDIVKILLSYLDEITLFEACAIGKFDAATHLIYTHPELINSFSEDGFTPLGLACYFGHSEIARFLVLKGAKLNVASQNGFNVYPIHSAVAANQTDIVRTLVDGGADVNVKQKSGVTPLHQAAQHGNLEILILLLENGARVDVRMEGGKLPADMARDKGFEDIAEILSY